MISIHIKKTLKTYNGLRTLRIKKELLPGSICLVTGPSGAGKTTFLKILAGLISADSGIIKINDITWLNTLEKINLSPQQRLAGFVFQDYALFPNMTVLQHMKYATQDEAWIKRLLITGQLQNFSTHKPAQLSGGQQQRLAILRALAIKPRLLLMDEPFSALDIQMKTALINNLRQLITEIGATTIIVSHNQQELNSLSDDELLIE